MLDFPQNYRYKRRLLFSSLLADCQPRWRSGQRQQQRGGPVREQRSTTEESGGIGDVRDPHPPGVDQSQQPDQYHQAVGVPDG